MAPLDPLHYSFVMGYPFKAFAAERIGGNSPNGTLAARCHREFYHAQWAILFDDAFSEASILGIVIDCCDGIRRRFYPHILPLRLSRAF